MTIAQRVAALQVEIVCLDVLGRVRPHAGLLLVGGLQGQSRGHAP